MQDCAEAFEGFVEKWKGKYPKLELWSEKAERMLTFYEFPGELRGHVYANNRIESFNKRIKGALEKQMQFVTEEALGKRLVSMFLDYNEGGGKRKVRCWREIVAYRESKRLKFGSLTGIVYARFRTLLTGKRLCRPMR